MPTTAFAAGAYAATQGLAGLGQARKPAAAGAAGGEFGALLQGAVDGFAQSGRKAEAQALAAAAGKADVVDVVTETLVAVRDRVIAAYEEIMRMPI
ncbi:MAG: flagellar hook-basal body complex protein FliE [Microvirga sp.]